MWRKNIIGEISWLPSGAYDEIGIHIKIQSSDMFLCKILTSLQTARQSRGWPVFIK